jgi:hypothetical protein
LRLAARIVPNARRPQPSSAISTAGCLSSCCAASPACGRSRSPWARSSSTPPRWRTCWTAPHCWSSAAAAAASAGDTSSSPPPRPRAALLLSLPLSLSLSLCLSLAASSCAVLLRYSRAQVAPPPAALTDIICAGWLVCPVVGADATCWGSKGTTSCRSPTLRRGPGGSCASSSPPPTQPPRWHFRPVIRRRERWCTASHTSWVFSTAARARGPNTGSSAT